MSKLQKILAGIIAVCVVFFGFVVVRIVAAPNDTSVKLAKIPQDKQLGKEAYKEAYPLEYNSFMKNNDTSPSPTVRVAESGVLPNDALSSPGA